MVPAAEQLLLHLERHLERLDESRSVSEGALRETGGSSPSSTSSPRRELLRDVRTFPAHARSWRRCAKDPGVRAIRRRSRVRHRRPAHAWRASTQGAPCALPWRETRASRLEKRFTDPGRDGGSRRDVAAILGGGRRRRVRSATTNYCSRGRICTSERWEQLIARPTDRPGCRRERPISPVRGLAQIRSQVYRAA
jgi:hypothetical protein